MIDEINSRMFVIKARIIPNKYETFIKILQNFPEILYSLYIAAKIICNLSTIYKGQNMLLKFDLKKK